MRPVGHEVTLRTFLITWDRRARVARAVDARSINAAIQTQ
jgi:hypothetical protein